VGAAISLAAYGSRLAQWLVAVTRTRRWLENRPGRSTHRSLPLIPLLVRTSLDDMIHMNQAAVAAGRDFTPFA
jgi:hypothetical protein